MIKPEKERYLEMPTIAYYAITMDWVLLIKEIKYGINDKIVFVDGDKVRCVALLARANGESYFRYNGMRINLSDCPRV